jgi:beta-fructofuranosidase
MNDPNGLVYFNGLYHVFFQWNRIELNHSYKEWGLFTSENMISWNFFGSALLPDQYYDFHGVYSGSGYEINNQLYLFYTGNSRFNGERKSYQCLAISEDGKRYLKKGPILTTPKEYTEHFRDPKVFSGKESLFLMVIGGQLRNGCGAIALCRSENGIEWEYVNKLATSNLYQMIECPDLFNIDGTNVLIYCPQKRDNNKDENISSFAAYKLGKFNEADGIFDSSSLDSNFKLVDYGFDFYAPQTFKDKDGRRLMLAWMSNMDGEQEKKYSENEKNLHCMTIPRELSIISNTLYQKPITEMYELLGKELLMKIEDTNIVLYPEKRSLYLSLHKLNIKDGMSINLFDNEFIFSYDKSNQLLKISRMDWVSNEFEYKCYDFRDITEIEMWIDSSSVEIFVNKGEFSLSSRIYPIIDKLSISIQGINKSTKVQANEIRAIKMNGGE